MFNTDFPTRADLPTAAQLARSTRKALLAASAILVFIVLPAEYGIDPTRVGRLLGLTEMGEIKQQLAGEAAAAAPAATVASAAPLVDPALLSREVERAVAAALAARDAAGMTTPASVAAPAAAAPAPAPGVSVAALVEEVVTEPAAGRSDEMTITLAPGEGAEVKLSMAAGAIADFDWMIEGGVANFDMHGEGSGQKITYGQGRAVPGATGAIEAAFDGSHGWFWRNRGDEPVTLILRTEGDYSEIKRLT